MLWQVGGRQQPAQAGRKEAADSWHDMSDSEQACQQLAGEKAGSEPVWEADSMAEGQAV